MMPLRILSGLALVAGSGFAVGVARAGTGVRAALGASWRRTPTGRPPTDHYRGGRFRNRLRGPDLEPGSGGRILKAMATRGSAGKPAGDIPLAADPLPADAADLAVTWLGHASVLVELDGRRILVDPVWGERVSPSAVIGPKRLHPAPVAFCDLPPVDVVLVSHDHYDHLDLPTVRLLLTGSTAPFVVPLGIGDHLRRWGVPEHRVIELDWDDEVDVAGVRLVCTEARHFSGRGLTRNDTLWSTWALVGPRHRVFVGGDTGYTPAFTAIGERFGPFDVTVLPIGAYGEFWPDIHLTPEEAVRTHQDLRGGTLLPMHWATFDLAFHPWAEPVERLLTAAADAGVDIAVPRPGARLTAFGGPVTDRWWTGL